MDKWGIPLSFFFPSFLTVEFAQTYTPPKESAILRLRTIDYPAEDHPLQHKVVLQVSPSKLGLTPTQLHKFLLLAGPRYDPAREELKISSERYQNRTLNLKWASDALDRLIAEAKVSSTVGEWEDELSGKLFLIVA